MHFAGGLVLLPELAENPRQHVMRPAIVRHQFGRAAELDEGSIELAFSLKNLSQIAARLAG